MDGYGRVDEKNALVDVIRVPCYPPPRTTEHKSAVNLSEEGQVRASHVFPF
jgi:hypothetical protein